MTKDEFIFRKLWLDKCWHKSGWHRIENSHLPILCTKCKKPFEEPPSLITWEGFGMLKDRIVERGMWEKFFRWWILTDSRFHSLPYIVIEENLNPKLFRDLVFTWLGGKIHEQS